LRILLSAKDRGDDRAGGIVDGCDEDGTWLVGPNHRAGCQRSAGACRLARNDRGGVDGAGYGEDGEQVSPPHAGCDAHCTTEEDGLLASQELGDVDIIAVSVALGLQRANLCADGISQGPGLGSVAIAMDERDSAVVLTGGFDAPDSVFRNAQELGGSKGGAVACDEAIQDRQRVLFVGC
jgi:hypothetical protein